MLDNLGERYKIIKKLGGGGMAIVYLTEDQFLDRQVAVKVLRDEYEEDPEFVRHFHKEAKSVAALKHPNIVNIYDFDANSHPIYLVMEYIEGKTLKEVVNHHGPLDWKEVCDIGIQIASGLAEAHRNHIIHKDVKSHNILIDKNGLVKITDFGIAQMSTNTTITHNKGILGSAHYFSPEQARGEQVDPKSDIYSLGVVFYEMITGQLPFLGDNPVTVALKHIQDKPVRPRQIIQNIPKEVEDVILKCLEKKRSNRFNNMLDLARKLEEIRSREVHIEINANESFESTHSDSLKDNYASETLALPRDFTKKNNISHEPKKKGKKKKNFFELVAVILILVLVAFLTIQGIMALSNKADIRVPYVEGMDIGEAKILLKENKLRIDIVEEKFSSDVKKDIIITQRPEANSIVKEGREIEVVISKGPETVKLPNLTDKSLEDARKILRDLDLDIGQIESDYSDEIREGNIISQIPEKDNKVNKNSKVNLKVSLGKKNSLLSMPDVRGKNLDNAKSTLENAGLFIDFVNEKSSTNIDQGLIIDQSVAAGTQVEKGSKVSLTVSTGMANMIKSVDVSFTIPNDGLLIIQQIDEAGENIVHSGNYRTGNNFSRNFNYIGAGKLIFTLNNQVIKEVILK